MRRAGLLALLATALFLPGGLATAQDASPPRVLILGDVIYQQFSRDLSKELGKTVKLEMPRTEPGEVFHSTHLLAQLDDLLGEETWDLIHFNCGLGDLIHRAPNMKPFRVLPIPAGGVRTTAPVQYRRSAPRPVKSSNPVRRSSSTTSRQRG